MLLEHANNTMSSRLTESPSGVERPMSDGLNICSALNTPKGLWYAKEEYGRFVTSCL